MQDFLTLIAKARRPVWHDALALCRAYGLAEIGFGVEAEITFTALSGIKRDNMIADFAAPSWPKIAGNAPSGSSPDSVNASV